LHTLSYGGENMIAKNFLLFADQPLADTCMTQFLIVFENARVGGTNCMMCMACQQYEVVFHLTVVLQLLKIVLELDIVIF